MTLEEGRHDRGWPKTTLMSWTTTSDQSLRFCVQVCGRRDARYDRGNYLEIIQWLPSRQEEKKP